MKIEQEKQILQSGENLLAENNRYLDHLVLRLSKDVKDLRKAIEKKLEKDREELEYRIKSNEESNCFLYDLQEPRNQISKQEEILKLDDDNQFIHACKINAINPYKTNIRFVSVEEDKKGKIDKLYKRVDKIAALQSLKECLPEIPTHTNQVIEGIAKYKKLFNHPDTEALFNKPADVQHRKNIKHILFTLFSGLIYAGVRALYSKYDRNSFAFYKPRKELLQDELTNAEKAVEDRKPKLSK